MTTLAHRLAAACFAALFLTLAGCAIPTAPAESGPSAAAAAVSATASAPAPVAAASASAPAVVASGVGVVPATANEAMSEPPVPVDPLRPEVRLDLDSRATRVDLWERVRAGFAMPDLDGERVRARERWYATRPDYVDRMTARGGRYLFHIVEELDKRGMPTELALLPFIESAYNPQAMSTARASGMWQFIPSTGRDFELKQNVFRDDRRSVLDSTRAALDYLQRLYGLFNDWQLALAAYNWGEGSVQRAIAKNQKAGLPTDYASLKMPAETADYVPKLQAVKNIVKNPQAFGLTLPELFNHPYFLAVPVERDIDVDLAVRLSDMDMDEFKALNPQLNRPVILAAGTPQILLPYDNANDFVRQLPKHRGPLASWTAWSVPRNMKAGEAAKLVGMNEAQLREVNQVPAHMLIRAGSTLLVPRVHSSAADVPGTVADNATLAFAPDAPPPRRVSLRAGRRDTVASVARRYRTSPAQVAQWNNVGANASFRPGQTVVVYVAQGGRKVSAASAASAAPAATTPRGVPVKATATRTAGAGKGKTASAATRTAKATRASGKASAGATAPVKGRTSPSTARAGGPRNQSAANPPAKRPARQAGR